MVVLLERFGERERERAGLLRGGQGVGADAGGSTRAAKTAAIASHSSSIAMNARTALAQAPSLASDRGIIAGEDWQLSWVAGVASVAIMLPMSTSEAIETFDCFGGSVSVIVMGAGPGGAPAAAVAMVRRRLLEWHSQFSRFEADSELSRLNRDPRETVPVSPVMARLIEAVLAAAAGSGGLVDATLVGEIENAGYAGHFDAVPVPLARALELAPPRNPAGPRVRPRWREMVVDRSRGTVTRPLGTRFDSGGIAKGLFGDILAAVLDGHQSFALDCVGDLRLGGSAGLGRSVQVANPFADAVLHVFELRDGAVATSGIGRRSWLDRDGHPAHHLLDPASGRPAFTGIVQVTAIAPSGVEAEWLTKAALLSGPAEVRRWLPYGGLVVYDDARFEVFEAAR